MNVLPNVDFIPSSSRGMMTRRKAGSLALCAALSGCGYRPSEPPVVLSAQNHDEADADLAKLVQEYDLEDRHPHKAARRNDVIGKGIDFIDKGFLSSIRTADENSGFMRDSFGILVFTLSAVAVFVRPTWPGALAAVFKSGDANAGSDTKQEFSDPKAWGAAREAMFSARDRWRDDYLQRKAALPASHYTLEFAKSDLRHYWALGHPEHAMAWLEREKSSTNSTQRGTFSDTAQLPMARDSAVFGQTPNFRRFKEGPAPRTTRGVLP